VGVSGRRGGGDERREEEVPYADPDRELFERGRACVLVRGK
jgi:hypothetical protein